MPTGSNAEQGTLDYAVEQLLAPEQEQDAGTAEGDQSEENLHEQDETEGTEADAEESEQDDSGDADEEDELDEEDSDETDADEDDEPDGDADDDAETEPTFTVTVDGKERAVTLSELKRGYSGQAYIQEGMEQVAAQRREVEQVYTSLNQDRQQLQTLIQQLSTGGLPQQPVEPTREQFPNDPLGFMEARDQYHQDVRIYQQRVGELNQAVQQQSMAQQQAMQARAQMEAQQLREAIPELRSGDKAKVAKALEDFKTTITSAAEAYGYTQDEIEGVVDHRNLLVLRDAARWRALQEKRNGARQDAENRPRRGKGKGKTLRPGAASKRKSSQRAKQRQQQRERLRQSGSLDDAAAMIYQEPS